MLVELMKKYKSISLLLIFPFTLVFTLNVFSFLLKTVLPGLISFWLASFIYKYITDRNIKESIRNPFFSNFK